MSENLSDLVHLYLNGHQSAIKWWELLLSGDAFWETISENNFHIVSNFHDIDHQKFIHLLIGRKLQAVRSLDPLIFGNIWVILVSVIGKHEVSISNGSAHSQISLPAMSSTSACIAKLLAYACISEDKFNECLKLLIGSFPLGLTGK